MSILVVVYCGCILCQGKTLPEIGIKETGKNYGMTDSEVHKRFEVVVRNTTHTIHIGSVMASYLIVPRTSFSWSQPVSYWYTFSPYHN